MRSSWVTFACKDIPDTSRDSFGETPHRSQGIEGFAWIDPKVSGSLSPFATEKEKKVYCTRIARMLPQTQFDQRDGIQDLSPIKHKEKKSQLARKLC